MSSRIGRRNLLKHLFIGTISASIAIVLSNCASPPKASNPVEYSKNDASTSSATAKSTVLRIGFITTDGSKIPVSPEGWAQQKGYLSEELKSLGISEVKFFPFTGGPALNEALAGGALDMGIYGDTPALVGRSAGLKTKLISQGRIGQNSWLLTNKEGIKSLNDLRGQKIGVAKGTYMHRYLLGLLDQKSLTKNVTLVQIPIADAKAALEHGDIAAYPFSIGSGPLLASQGFPILDQAKDHEGLSGTSATIATEAILAQYPNLPQKWNQIRHRALQQVKTNPEAYYQFAAEASNNRYPLSVIKESYEISSYPIEPFTPEGLKTLNSTKQFLAGQKLLKSDFDIKDWQVPM